MAEEQVVLFETQFLHDVRNPDELATLYPYIKAREPATLNVHDGVLVKEGRADGDELFPGEEGVSDITYNIAITCDSDRYNVGLGCYVGSDAAPWARGGRVNNRFCFHPGMRGGQFRIEGPGGHGNEDIGFTPPSSEAGKCGCTFTVQLKKTGQHKVTITHPEGPHRGTFTSEWTNAALWTEDRAPPFGIYAGDVRRAGRVFYKDFSVSSASAISAALNVQAERLDSSFVKLTFLDISGAVVSTRELSVLSTAVELLSALQPEFPKMRLVLIFPDGTTINSRSADIAMDSLVQ